MKTATLWVAVIATLFASFEFNVFRVADAGAVATFQVDSDLLVAEGVTAARDGDIGYGGFMVILPENANPLHKPIPELRAGRNGRLPYVSQFGLQGIVLAAFAPRDVRDVPRYLSVARAISALLLAAILGWFVIAAHRTLGRLEAVVLLVGFVCSPWLILFSRSLYWQLWTFYLPVVAIWWAYRRARPSSIWLACLVAFVAVLVRELCSYEYGTNVVLACGLPIVILDCTLDRPWRAILWNCLRVQAAGGAALVVALGAHVAKLGLLLHSTSGAIEAIRARLIVRSFGTSVFFGEDFFKPRPFCEFIGAHTPWIPAQCENVIYIGRYLTLPAIAVPATHLAIPFGVLLMVFAIVVVRELRKRGELSREDRTWRWALGVSFVASVSWAIVMPYHMLNHVHLNSIIWYLPFWPVAFAFLARRSRSLLRLDRK